MTTIYLPYSKSICNRVLLLNALSHSPYTIENLSTCDDTCVMQEALKQKDSHIQVGAAGTAMRFLTAYFAQQPGDWVLSGTKRMHERPVKLLVDALNQLGGCVEYVEKEGYPPLRIKGGGIRGGSCVIDGSVSSQYISALMMIAPNMQNGLHLQIVGEMVSKDYITMTIALMQHYGAQIIINENEIQIPPQKYTPRTYEIERDWSAASYFYEWLALQNERHIFLPGLQNWSLQGDAACAELFRPLGIETQYQTDGVYLSVHPCKTTDEYVQNLVNHPDLVPAIAVTCCLKNIPFQLSGLKTLYIKESNRIEALVRELEKLGYILTSDHQGNLSWNGTKCLPKPNPCIETYDDHRIAMAFAPAAILHPTLSIAHPEVVNKSFPDFWKEYSKLC